LCEDAVRSRIAIEVALFSARAREQYGEIVQTVERVAAQSFDIPDMLARQLGDTDSPQGIFCICRMPSLNGTLTPDGVYIGEEPRDNIFGLSPQRQKFFAELFLILFLPPVCVLCADYVLIAFLPDYN
ncbi:MAG: hypothetical protein IJO52_06365, partial [Clostridia bacterium]|nr:hypothetical protein [Clostridia bacterium]